MSTSPLRDLAGLRTWVVRNGLDPAPLDALAFNLVGDPNGWHLVTGTLGFADFFHVGMPRRLPHGADTLLALACGRPFDPDDSRPNLVPFRELAQLDLCPACLDRGASARLYGWGQTRNARAISVVASFDIARNAAGWCDGSDPGRLRWATEQLQRDTVIPRDWVVGLLRRAAGVLAAHRASVDPAVLYVIRNTDLQHLEQDNPLFDLLAAGSTARPGLLPPVAFVAVDRLTSERFRTFARPYPFSDNAVHIVDRPVPSRAVLDLAEELAVGQAPSAPLADLGTAVDTAVSIMGGA